VEQGSPAVAQEGPQDALRRDGTQPTTLPAVLTVDEAARFLRLNLV